jgi:hypothetical protein
MHMPNSLFMEAISLFLSQAQQSGAAVVAVVAAILPHPAEAAVVGPVQPCGDNVVARDGPDQLVAPRALARPATSTTPSVSEEEPGRLGDVSDGL